MTNHTLDPAAAAVSLTDAAAQRIAAILAAETTPGQKLRLSVQGGGCSGLSYGFDLDAEQNVEDCIVERLGATLIIDPISLQYLAGAVVDYRERLEGAMFVVRNPQAKSNCGCGSSFSA
jgi:iron-sulfur cluster insertion protein